jgi:uncharacterized OsmC-like protein
VLDKDLDQARRHIFRTRVTGRGGMEAQVFVRNHSFTVGQPLSFDSADKEVSALEYLMGALGACIAVGFQWRASQRGIKVNKLEIALQTKLENPLVYLGLDNSGQAGLASAELTIYVDCDAGQEMLDHLLQETMRLSPVTQSLKQSIAITAEVRSVS